MNMSTFYGPFGKAPHGSSQALLNHLSRSFQVPTTVLEQLQIDDWQIKYEGKMIGRYKWFDEIDRPLVKWSVAEFDRYSAHSFIHHEQKDEKTGGVSRFFLPKFGPTLSCHGTPVFEISGNRATPELYDFLWGMLTNNIRDERYKISKDAGALFQGGYGSRDGKWFMIEFWRPEGVEEFIDYLNNNYREEVKEVLPSRKGLTLQEIKDAVDAGKTVHWVNSAYTVVKDNFDRYLISFKPKDQCENYIGLTHADGVTLNGFMHNFYLEEEHVLSD